MMQQLGTFCWWLDLLLMIRVWKSFFLGSVITWSLMRSSQKSAAGMIPYPSRSWASNRKRCPPNLWILDVFLGLHPTDSPSTKKKACGLSHSFFWGISRMMRLPGNSKRLYLLCEISYGLPQRLTGTHVFFWFFQWQASLKEDVIAESGAKRTAGGSAGSAVTPRKMDIPSFLRPFFGANY